MKSDIAKIIIAKESRQAVYCTDKEEPASVVKNLQASTEGPLQMKAAPLFADRLIHRASLFRSMTFVSGDVFSYKRKLPYSDLYRQETGPTEECPFA
nr:hypothetical protein [Herbaspirillum sp. CF444]